MNWQDMGQYCVLLALFVYCHQVKLHLSFLLKWIFAAIAYSVQDQIVIPKLCKDTGHEGIIPKWIDLPSNFWHHAKLLLDVDQSCCHLIDDWLDVRETFVVLHPTPANYFYLTSLDKSFESFFHRIILFIHPLSKVIDICPDKCSIFILFQCGDRICQDFSDLVIIVPINCFYPACIRMRMRHKMNRDFTNTKCEQKEQNFH